MESKSIYPELLAAVDPGNPKNTKVFKVDAHLMKNLSFMAAYGAGPNLTRYIQQAAAHELQETIDRKLSRKHEFRGTYGAAGLQIL